MIARRFMFDDLATINEWHVSREQLPTTREMLPVVGCIVDGVACGFVYRTDSAIGFLDGFVTNPAASAEARQQGLAAVMRAIEAECRDSGTRVIIGQCEDYAFAKHAVDLHGFSRVAACIRFAKSV